MTNCKYLVADLFCKVSEFYFAWNILSKVKYNVSHLIKTKNELEAETKQIIVDSIPPNLNEEIESYYTILAKWFNVSVSTRVDPNRVDSPLILNDQLKQRLVTIREKWKNYNKIVHNTLSVAEGSNRDTVIHELFLIRVPL